VLQRCYSGLKVCLYPIDDFPVAVKGSQRPASPTLLRPHRCPHALTKHGASSATHVMLCYISRLLHWMVLACACLHMCVCVCVCVCLCVSHRFVGESECDGPAPLPVLTCGKTILFALGVRGGLWCVGVREVCVCAYVWVGRKVWYVCAKVRVWCVCF
jgi:hypothetical protein